MTAQTARPWGFFGSLGWALLAVAVAATAMFALGKAFGIIWFGEGGGYGHPSMSLTMIVGYCALVATLGLAARLARPDVADYLGVVKPRGRYLLATAACLVLPAFLSFAHAMHFDVNELFRTNGFQRSGIGGAAIHFLTVAVAAPIMEELLFRGFLYRGLASSRIGVTGAIIVTSLLWMLMHGGRGAAGNVDLVLGGVALGWLRWYSGSTLTTIACHVVNNALFSTLVLTALFGWI